MRPTLVPILLTLALGCGGDSGPSDPGDNNPPPPPPDPTLSSVTCTLDAIADMEYEGATRPSVAFAWSGYGVMSDATETALDSAVMKVGSIRVQKFTGGTSGSGTLGSGDTEDGNNTLSITCYRETRTGADTEGFRMSRIVNLPTIDLAGVVLDMDEDGSAEADLSGIVTDGTLTGVQVSSGPVSIELRNDSVFVTPTADANGSYTLQFTATNDDGDANESGSWTIQPITDFLAGRLEDSETDTGSSGELRIYDGGQLLETISTNGSGNWAKTNLPDASQYRIEAELDAGSYIRTVRVSPASTGADVEVGLIRAVPISNVDGRDFKVFSLEWTVGIGNLILKNEFQHVCYLVENPEPNRGGTFSQDQRDIVTRKWADPTDIPRFFEGRTSSVQVCDSSDYSVGPDNLVVPQKGNLVIVPDDTLFGLGIGGAGAPLDVDFDGMNDSGTVRIAPQLDLATFEKVTGHEPGHLYGAQHPSSEFNDRSIMAYPVELIQPGLFDEKFGYVVGEETFKNGEDLNDILGL